MAPDDRRQAIVGALIPLLVERGSDVTTKEIAHAAGIAEGTIFRVFADKRSLFLAAAEEAMNPVGGEQAFDAALADVTDLRDGVVVVTRRVLERMRLTMSVMMAVRPQLIAAFHEEKAAGGKPELGPPPFVLKAQNDLHRRLTRLFEPYADRLAVDPDTAAIALRSLIFGSHRPELGMSPALTADQIADLLLGGVLARKDL
jgi:AcrR family transcriptional regulator